MYKTFHEMNSILYYVEKIKNLEFFNTGLDNNVSEKTRLKLIFVMQNMGIGEDDIEKLINLLDELIELIPFINVNTEDRLLYISKSKELDRLAFQLIYY